MEIGEGKYLYKQIPLAFPLSPSFFQIEHVCFYFAFAPDDNKQLQRHHCFSVENNDRLIDSVDWQIVQLDSVD